jgi:molybdate transport system substrate-binding protein
MPVRWPMAALVIPIALAASGKANAAEIRVLCSNGIKAVMADLAPRFEQATSHTVRITYGVSAALQRQIAAGDRFDVAILTAPLIDRAIEQGTIAAATRVVVARSAIVLAIRAGAPAPDIRTAAALTRALLDSQSVTYAMEGAGGVFFTALVQQLGLADGLKSRLRPLRTGDEVSASVANGGAELAVLPLSEILPVAGAKVLGPFPAGLEGYMVMSAGLSASTTQSDAAHALVEFLMAPAASAVFERKGMERPAP